MLLLKLLLSPAFWRGFLFAPHSSANVQENTPFPMEATRTLKNYLFLSYGEGMLIL